MVIYGSWFMVNSGSGLLLVQGSRFKVKSYYTSKDATNRRALMTRSVWKDSWS